MSDFNALESLQTLHRDLLSICERRLDTFPLLEQVLEAHSEEFRDFLDKPARAKKSRDAVESGTWFWRAHLGEKFVC